MVNRTHIPFTVARIDHGANVVPIAVVAYPTLRCFIFATA